MTLTNEIDMQIYQIENERSLKSEEKKRHYRRQREQDKYKETNIKKN